MKRILLVEDNEMIRENTAELLELMNYAVLTARNGQEGLEVACREVPDLIICDIMMPEMNGYHLLQALRCQQSTLNVPFIFFTASAEKSEIKKGLDMGATDYIVKPFDADDQLQMIAKHLPA